jgi:hypothetical protein
MVKHRKLKDSLNITGLRGRGTLSTRDLGSNFLRCYDPMSTPEDLWTIHREGGARL